MSENTPLTSRDKVSKVAPGLVELSKRVLFGEVWERPGLSKRDRSLVTVAALLAMGRSEQLRGHLDRALDNGVSREELGETITHLAFYCGWPAAMTAGLIANEVFDQKK
jgi:4-carboxymuconolactone decarboxylase